MQRECEGERRTVKRSRDERYSTHTSLVVASLKKLLSVGLNRCCQGDRDLVSLAVSRFSEVDCFMLWEIVKLYNIDTTVLMNYTF